MDLSTLNIIIWVPFALVALIAGLRFMITGFRRGLWVALINLAATLAAGWFCVLLAKWLSPLIINPVAEFLTGLLPPEAAAAIAEGGLLVQALLTMIAGLLLFPPLFFVLSGVARWVCNLFLKKLLRTRSLLMRLTGLAAGIVHAAAFSILLLLPLYGTLSTFLPTAQAVMAVQSAQSEEATAVMDLLTEHPLVQLCDSEPVQLFYRELTNVRVDGNSFAIAELAEGAQQLLVQLLSGEFDPKKLVEAGTLDIVGDLLDNAPDLKEELLTGVLSNTLLGGDQEAAAGLVQAVLDNEKTAALLDTDTLQDLIASEDAAAVLEQHPEIDTQALQQVLQDTGILDKLDTDALQAFLNKE